MIVGIGTDLVNISRIEASMARNPQALARRVLTPVELDHFLAAAKPAAYLAKRFAAKEAASKALGTGIGRISWQDLEVSNDHQGAPQLSCTGNAALRLAELGVSRVHLSLADEQDAALAFVVISREP